VPDAHTLRPAVQPVNNSSSGAGAEFRRAVTEMEAGIAEQLRLRAGLSAENEPPPRRLAPFASAVAVAVTDSLASSDTDAEIGSGKFVLLFDPAGQPGWDGKYRIIGYIRAELEPEMAADPLINEVGWSWLIEALEARCAGYRKISGTVTTVVTQGFGSKLDEPLSTGFELRASWSPAIADGMSAELDGHVAAWCEVICTAAGLPPLPPGVASLRPQRRRPRL
jgi:hypothetical protein